MSMQWKTPKKRTAKLANAVHRWFIRWAVTLASPAQSTVNHSHDEATEKHGRGNIDGERVFFAAS
jgi:hypothetical protein